MKKKTLSIALISLFLLSGCSISNEKISAGYDNYKSEGGDMTYDEWASDVKKNTNHGSIIYFAKAKSEGNVDTYIVLYEDGTTSSVKVTNGLDGHSPVVSINDDGYWCVDGVSTGVLAHGDTGNSIVSITKTSSEGLKDNYTITFSDGTSTTFTVTNGEKGDQGEKGKSAYDIYKENYPLYPGNESEWIKDLALGNLAVHVSFDTDGGTKLEDAVFCKGETVNKSSLPTSEKKDFNFTGWYKNSELNDPVTDSFTALNNTTFYAAYAEANHAKGQLLSLVTDDGVTDVKDAGLFTCKYCGEQYYDTVTYDDINVPVLNLDGSFDGISKENKVKITAEYQDGNQSFNSDATLKWQGSSSLAYPKKNYNIQLYKPGTDYKKKNKVELVDKWGKESKYTLKANYIDYSQSRNVVSGEIWGDIVKSRKNPGDLASAPNYGAVDGYPVLIFQNGKYQGLYTLNIAKDDWMFGMDDETKKQAIISAKDWTDSVALKEHIADDYSNGWELEYCSTEDDKTVGTSWVTESFNEFIDFLNNNDGDALKAGLGDYVDIEAAIDTLLYVSVMKAGDNTSKNMLWVTYDGRKWIPSMYDMDSTWGLEWEGKLLFSPNAYFPFDGNNLWKKVYDVFQNEVKDRWAELRKGALSISNIDKRFSDFSNKIPKMLFDAESKKWSDVPSQDTNHFSQIISWANEHLKNMDKYFELTIEDITPYEAKFNVDNGGSVSLFNTQDYSRKPDLCSTAFARNSETGLLDVSGDGQINFKVNVPDGYTIDSINVEGNYKNLKTPDDTGETDVYRITKVADNLNITITLKSV